MRATPRPSSCRRRPWCRAFLSPHVRRYFGRPISALDGSNPRQVSKESLAMITGPAWAPDGKSLIATRTSATVFEMRTSADSSLHARDRCRRADRRAAEERQGSAGSAPFARWPLSLLHRTARRRALRLRQHRPRQLRHPSQGSAHRRERSTSSPASAARRLRKCRRMASSVAFIRRVQAKTVLFRYDVESRHAASGVSGARPRPAG